MLKGQPQLIMLANSYIREYKIRSGYYAYEACRINLKQRDLGQLLYNIVLAVRRRPFYVLRSLIRSLLKLH